MQRPRQQSAPYGDCAWIKGHVEVSASPVGFVPTNGMSMSFESERLSPMKKPSQRIIAEVPRRQSKVEMRIGIDVGEVLSPHCTLDEKGELVDRGRFRTTPKGLEKCLPMCLRRESPILDERSFNLICGNRRCTYINYREHLFAKYDKRKCSASSCACS